MSAPKLPEKLDSSNESSEINVDSQMSSASELLDVCWQSPDKIHQIASMDGKTKKFKNIPVKDVAEAVHKALELSSQGNDAYFAVAEYLTSDSRKTANVAGASGFWMDIDCGEEKAKTGKGYPNEDAALKATKAFCKKVGISEPTYIIDSGSGIHLYWLFDTVIGSKEWKENADKLKALTHATGFLADDSRTADIASVLRIPSTLNYKYDPPKAVVLKHASAKLIKQELMLKAINKAFDKFCNTPVETTPEIACDTAELIPFSADPELEKLKSALMMLDPDCDEETWKLQRLAPLALLALQYPDHAEEIRNLAIDWSSGTLAGTPSVKWVTSGKSNDLTGEQAFEKEWPRFLKNHYAGKCVTVGTIYHDAKALGWNHSSDLEKSSAQSPLAVIQTYFCLIRLSGKVWVLDLEHFNKKTKGGEARKLELYNREHGSLLVMRKSIALFSSVDSNALAKEFFLSPETRVYQGVEFNPVSTSGDCLNLWIGPTLQPKAGDWALIKFFLLNIICDGDDKCYQYLIRYIAHAIQRPEEKPGVMIILLGGQGTGKGTLGRIFQKIWGATYLQVCNIRAITGNFNAALERTFIVFMDEALFAGNRRAADELKSVVTEPTVLINEKHQPARQMNSYHRIIAATNADHFKNTENDDRRDFVLRVSETHKGDLKYWKALHHEINSGGVSAMMGELMAIDLTEFNVRAKPSTKALLEQKLLSLDHIERWWFDCLECGNFSGEVNYGPYCNKDEEQWPEFLSTYDAIDGIKEIAGGKMYKNPTASDVKKALLKLCPSAKESQRKVANTRRRGLILPSLAQARTDFEQYMGDVIDWPENDD